MHVPSGKNLLFERVISSLHHQVNASLLFCSVLLVVQVVQSVEVVLDIVMEFHFFESLEGIISRRLNTDLAIIIS